jgi:hypothetical protein
MAIDDKVSVAVQSTKRRDENLEYEMITTKDDLICINYDHRILSGKEITTLEIWDFGDDSPKGKGRRRSSTLTLGPPKLSADKIKELYDILKKIESKGELTYDSLADNLENYMKEHTDYGKYAERKVN